MERKRIYHFDVEVREDEEKREWMIILKDGDYESEHRTRFSKRGLTVARLACDLEWSIIDWFYNWYGMGKGDNIYDGTKLEKK